MDRETAVLGASSITNSQASRSLLPFQQNCGVQCPKAVTQLLLELFLTNRQDLRLSIQSLSLFSRVKTDGLFRVVEDLVFEVLVVGKNVGNIWLALLN